ncbi:hypothetical protein Vafri_17890, partial [Volvox africanus]
MAQENDGKVKGKAFSTSTLDDFKNSYEWIKTFPQNKPPAKSQTGDESSTSIIKYKEAWRAIWDLAASSFDCVASTKEMYFDNEIGLEIALAPILATIEAMVDGKLKCEYYLSKGESSRGYLDFLFQTSDGINAMVIELKHDLYNSKYKNYLAQVYFELMAAWEENYDKSNAASNKGQCLDAAPVWGILMDRCNVEVFQLDIVINKDTKERGGSIIRLGDKSLPIFKKIESSRQHDMVVPSHDDMRLVFHYILRAVNSKCVAWKQTEWKNRARNIKKEAKKRRAQASKSHNMNTLVDALKGLTFKANKTGSTSEAAAA